MDLLIPSTKDFFNIGPLEERTEAERFISAGKPRISRQHSQAMARHFDFRHH
jgi:hypothetical protein